MYRDPVELLQSHFGYRGFRAGQEELIRAVLRGKDALGILPTGGGKSVCYQVPALTLGGIVLVITPLVSLMEDQVRRAREVGLRATHLSAAQTAQDRRSALKAAGARELDVLLVSPERLEVSSFRDALSGVDVRLLAIDEAHCISEWGHDFRPSYRRIGRIRSALSCPLLALTATATPKVREDICRNLALSDPVVVVRSFDRPNLSWSVGRGGTLTQRVSRIYEVLSGQRGAAIVYAPTRSMVERARDRLARRGLRAEAYHAGLPGEERTRVQNAFMEGACRVVVATNAFGMGIDKSDVRVVAHVQLPLTLEAYYQEAGRAGRDGKQAKCLAFSARGDRRRARAMLGQAHPPSRLLLRALRQLRSGADSQGVVRPESALLDRRGRRLSDEVRAGLINTLRRLDQVVSEDSTSGVYGTDRPGIGSLRLLGAGRPDLSPAAAHRRLVLAKLSAVQRYARGLGCRRRTLLRYFGEEAANACGSCDRCARPW
jgi:ATP-dependent DNA helicase RecQ